jgi:hypothetical protein
VDEYDFKTQRVSQTDEYIGGYLDAIVDQKIARAREEQQLERAKMAAWEVEQEAKGS